MIVYLQFYGYLSQQQNMMQDYIRTSTYQRAILANLIDFHDKVGLLFNDKSTTVYVITKYFKSHGIHVSVVVNGW